MNVVCSNCGNELGVRNELLKRLLYMENGLTDRRVTRILTSQEKQIAKLTIDRVREHIEQAFKGEVLEGKAIQ